MSHNHDGENNTSKNNVHGEEVRNDPWSEPLNTSPRSNLNNFYSPSFQTNSKTVNAVVEPKKKKEKSGAMRFFAMIMVCLVFCTAASALTTALVMDYKLDSMKNNQVTLGSPSVNPGSTPSDSLVTLPGDTLSASAIYDLACQQVVGVNTAITTTNIFGQQTETAVAGTGFIISDDGYIMTNYHVIEYAAVYNYELNVVMFDGSSYPAQIIGYEIENDTAVIKIDETELNAVTFGNSDDIAVGEDVFAVGHPLGELTYTMTTGRISALDRFISPSENVTMNMFQIDASVNSGNSGGPVYNNLGQVIGIVTAKYAEAGVEGLGFVIPINDALDIATQLIENGYVSGKPYLGISVQPISSAVAQYFNMPAGAYVYAVNEGSCAEKAGLKTGDVITAIGKYSITTPDELKSALRLHKAGETITITIYRSGETFDLQVTLDEQQYDSTTTQQPQGPQLPEGSMPSQG